MRAWWSRENIVNGAFSKLLLRAGWCFALWRSNYAKLFLNCSRKISSRISPKKLFRNTPSVCSGHLSNHLLFVYLFWFNFHSQASFSTECFVTSRRLLSCLLLASLAVFAFLTAPQVFFRLAQVEERERFGATRFSRAQTDADAVRNWVSEICCALFALSWCALSSYVASLLSFAVSRWQNNAPLVAWALACLFMLLKVLFCWHGRLFKAPFVDCSWILSLSYFPPSRELNWFIGKLYIA